MNTPTRCPNCGRFVEYDADGFYDRLQRESDSSLIAQFCSEFCADRFHEKRNTTITSNEETKDGYT